MIRTHRISSLDANALSPYRTLRQNIEHQRAGIFVAEGEKVVRRLTESNLTIVSVLTTEEWLAEYKPLLEPRDESVEVFVGSKELLETIVGYHLHQGIMAVAKIPAARDVETILNASAPPHLIVALDGMTNSENLGVLVRNCAAFGVEGIIVGETSSSPYLRRAVRNSMGTVFQLPVVQSSNLAATLGQLRSAHKLLVIGAHPAGKRTLFETNLKDDCCLVFGSEGEGISEGVLAACDLTVAVPMSHGVDSVNVANASAVFLFEAVRQRRSLR